MPFAIGNAVSLTSGRFIDCPVRTFDHWFLGWNRLHCPLKVDHFCEQLYPPLVLFFSDELGEFPARVPTCAHITKESDEESNEQSNAHPDGAPDADTQHQKTLLPSGHDSPPHKKDGARPDSTTFPCRRDHAHEPIPDQRRG